MAQAVPQPPQQLGLVFSKMDTKQHTRHVPQALCPQQTMTATMPCAGCVRRLRRITTRATSVEGKASVWACPRAARSSRCGVSVTRFVAAPVSSVCGCCARAPSGGNRRTPGSTSPLPISVCIWRAFWLAATMASAAWIQAQLNTRGCVHSEPHPSLTFGADPRSPFAPTHDGVDEVDQMSVGDAGFFLTSGLNKWCHQHPHIFGAQWLPCGCAVVALWCVVDHRTDVMSGVCS